MNLNRHSLMRSFLFPGIILTAAFTLGINGPVPAKAPDFNLQNSKGETITLSSLRGNVVALNFWATWCGPCRAEIPGFLEVYEEYKAKGLEIVGISLDGDGWQSVNSFVKNYDITYPVVLGDRQTVRKYGGISAIPTTFIVDRDGNIAAHHVGYMSKKDFRRQVLPLLEQ